MLLSECEGGWTSSDPKSDVMAWAPPEPRCQHLSSPFLNPSPSKERVSELDMSAPSGIKVPDDLKSAFSSAVSDASNTRALVFVIEGGEWTSACDSTCELVKTRLGNVLSMMNQN